MLEGYHAFRVQGVNSILGYIPNALVRSIHWPEECWRIDSSRAVTLTTPPGTAISTRTHIVDGAIRRMAEAGHREILTGWRNERFPVCGPDGGLVLEVERSASAMFGIVTSGVQMLCYVEDAQGRVRLWIAKRSPRKQTYPGMLDCTAAGALGMHESPRSAMILEATEEASISRETIEDGMKSVGSISYFHMKGRSPAGGDGGAMAALLLPEIEYLYELKLDQGTIPQPKDLEVESFQLWDVDRVLEALRSGLFKPNSAVVVIDFFIRHGIVTQETEPRYLEFISRLHRRLPFPTAQQSV